MEKIKIIESKIINDNIDRVNETYDHTDVTYIVAPDGHEYLITSAFAYGKGAGACTSVIHAAGCKKCNELN